MGTHFYYFPITNSSSHSENVTPNMQFNSLKEKDTNLCFDYDIHSNTMYVKAPIELSGVDKITDSDVSDLCVLQNNLFGKLLMN